MNLLSHIDNINQRYRLGDATVKCLEAIYKKKIYND